MACYYDRHREELLQKQKEYNKNNKDKYLEYQRQYYIHVKRVEQPIKEKKENKTFDRSAYNKMYYESNKQRLYRPYIKRNKTPDVLTPEEMHAVRQYTKGYEKKLLIQTQHSLPQAEPFSEFKVRKDGTFALEW
jgi:hypothetical protein